MRGAEVSYGFVVDLSKTDVDIFDQLLRLFHLGIVGNPNQECQVNRNITLTLSTIINGIKHWPNISRNVT